eukprot:TRINITY_DN33324_c0_g1_i4.p1 TRINITY_DN33324_c0_g1~~TRINITY_DN33324_c0_g1_i4.p1  ORF type:complete len:316 (-),score=13.33 TRINITY_DN33324_c0_g1_i4:80-1027(-)
MVKQSSSTNMPLVIVAIATIAVCWFPLLVPTGAIRFSAPHKAYSGDTATAEANFCEEIPSESTKKVKSLDLSKGAHEQADALAEDFWKNVRCQRTLALKHLLANQIFTDKKIFIRPVAEYMTNNHGETSVVQLFSHISKVGKQEVSTLPTTLDFDFVRKDEHWVDGSYIYSAHMTMKYFVLVVPSGMEGVFRDRSTEFHQEYLQQKPKQENSVQELMKSASRHTLPGKGEVTVYRFSREPTEIEDRDLASVFSKWNVYFTAALPIIRDKLTTPGLTVNHPLGGILKLFEAFIQKNIMSPQSCTYTVSLNSDTLVP